MIDLERLFELLDEAERGASCGCSVTTRAYLRMAKMELFTQMNDVRPRVQEERVRAAYFYIERLASRRKSLLETIQFLIDFWTGYDDGQHERTMPQRGRPVYRRGYRFGRDGS